MRSSRDPKPARPGGQRYHVLLERRLEGSGRGSSALEADRRLFLGGSVCPSVRPTFFASRLRAEAKGQRMKTAKDVVAFAKDRGAVMVDLKFMDFVGIWQHFTIPLHEMTEGIFEEGLGFDGSSIRGWQEIHASDMLVVPDASSAVMDPFMKDPTLSLICNISDPITRESYSRDPRNIAIKAEKYLKSTGLADTAYFGPEAEFFIFDQVRYDSDT